MHLMYTLDSTGRRQYTLKKVQDGEVTKSAHPARFSPDDKYSRQRNILKKRYGLLLTQQPVHKDGYAIQPEQMIKKEGIEIGKKEEK